MSLATSFASTARSFYDLFAAIRPARVVVADRNRPTRERLLQALTDEGYDAVGVGSARELAKSVEAADLVIADVDLLRGRSDGLKSRHEAGGPPLILLTDRSKGERVAERLRVGDAYVCDKSDGPEDILLAAMSLVLP